MLILLLINRSNPSTISQPDHRLALLEPITAEPVTTLNPFLARSITTSTSIIAISTLPITCTQPKLWVTFKRSILFISLFLFSYLKILLVLLISSFCFFQFLLLWFIFLFFFLGFFSLKECRNTLLRLFLKFSLLL